MIGEINKRNLNLKKLQLQVAKWHLWIGGILQPVALYLSGTGQLRARLRFGMPVRQSVTVHKEIRRLFEPSSECVQGEMYAKHVKKETTNEISR